MQDAKEPSRNRFFHHAKVKPPDIVLELRAKA